MKRSMIMLMLYLCLFSFLFFLSIYNYRSNVSIIDIGFSRSITNLLLIGFSAAGIVKSVWHIYTF